MTTADRQVGPRQRSGVVAKPSASAHSPDASLQASPARNSRLGWMALPVAVLVVMLVALLATRDSGMEREASSAILGQLAPPIVGVTADGEPFDLDDWSGRWVLVNFFSTTCVPCIIEHPELVAFSERHASGDARLVSVVFDDSPANVKEFFDANGGDWPVVAEGAGQAAVRYGVTGVPESYLVAPSRIVVWKQLGGVTAGAIDDVIARLTSPT